MWIAFLRSIYTENIKRGENADFGTNSRLYSDKEEDIVIESILDIYDTFKQKVIDGRANLNDINELDENAKDLVEIPKNIKEKLNIIPVKWIDQVLEIALERMPEIKISQAKDSATPKNKSPTEKNLPH